MTVKDAMAILGMTIVVVWGLILLAGILFIAWDLIRDWDAERRIKKLIAAEGLPDPNYVVDVQRGAS